MLVYPAACPQLFFHLYFNHSDGELQECKKKEYR